MGEWCEHWRGPGSGQRECDHCGLVGKVCLPTRALQPHVCVWWQRVRAERAEEEARRWRGVAEGLECALRDLAFNVPSKCELAREEFLRVRADSLTPTSIPKAEDVAGIYAKGQSEEE